MTVQPKRSVISGCSQKNTFLIYQLNLDEGLTLMVETSLGISGLSG